MRRPITAGNRLLTPQNLLADFGARAAVTREGVRTLFEAIPADGHAAWERWQSQSAHWAGRHASGPAGPLARLVARYGIRADAGDGTAVLFALQSYYALLVRLVAERFGQGRLDAGLPNCPFAWCDSAEVIRPLTDRLRETLAGYRIAPAADDGGCDLFKPLYQDLFPRAVRHRLGEYYTPDWLAEHVLDQVGYTGQPGQRLLDPACGSGTFLMVALRRWQRMKGEGRRERGEGRVDAAGSKLLPCLPPIVGFDLNPLAVMTARVNYLIAVADLLPDGEPFELPVYLRDSILGSGEEDAAGAEPFDFVVGNPPWIAWDNLPEEDRRATKPLWERYGLFSLSGNEARYGGGKKDLSMLMLYAAADRYLRTGGRLGMVITQTLLQTRGAGDGFRRFRLGADGPPLKVLRVDDMVALRPFGDAANWTSTIVLEKGAATEYPVPYVVWGEGRNEKGEGRREKGEGRRETRIQGSTKSCLARPIDPARATSPWMIVESGKEAEQANPKSEIRNPKSEITVSLPPSPFSLLPSPFSVLPAHPYSAHLGANSGGANGVYWVEVLDEQDGGVRVRNITAKSKRAIEPVEAVIEPDLLYPLLRWGDVRRYAAVPRGYVLLAQDPATRTGIAEAVMRARYPWTLAYLERFRELLVSRAAYRRYQGGGPFYSMYNVGPYTIAPVKVVWRRMDRRINAAVVEPGGWGGSCTATPGATVQLSPQLAPQPRPAVPQETCVLVACESADEAHYLCAVLNSAAVNDRVAAHSVRGGKGFGTPGMLEYLPLARYRSDEPLHAELAALSRKAHAAAAPLPTNLRSVPGEGQGEGGVSVQPELQRRMDELVSKFAFFQS
jgi:hypothetical protein